MRKLLLLLLLVSPLLAGTSWAQADDDDLDCDACRDAGVYPEDIANFAFNQIYGPEAWMTFDQADDFFVSDQLGQTVYVDVDFVMHGWSAFGINLPFWPDNMLNITIAQPDGNIVEFLRSVFLTSLPVPAGPDLPPTPQDDSGPTSTGNDDDEEDDEEEDYDDADPGDWEEPETDDPDGVVDIEDPDEFGDFDDGEWCEEC